MSRSMAGRCSGGWVGFMPCIARPHSFGPVHRTIKICTSFLILLLSKTELFTLHRQAAQRLRVIRCDLNRKVRGQFPAPRPARPTSW